MRSKFFNWGGIAAAVVLIAFGIGATVMGVNGRDTVRSNLGTEEIVGTPDMTPSAIAAEAKAAGLKNVSIPSKSVAGQKINTGDRARVFAQYMRIHALEGTGGQVYSQMGRYLTASGKATDNDKVAAKDPKTGKPVENGARNLWVTETALSTALNTSYFAENVATFAIVMGVALLLTGIGFLVLTLGLVAPRQSKEAQTTAPATKAVPAT
jgi:uncharacterized iron-regulated membrane protein